MVSSEKPSSPARLAKVWRSVWVSTADQNQATVAA